MANWYDKNWVRVCVTIDKFRARYERWPKRVKLSPFIFANLVGDVLTPVGYALVSSVVELRHGEFPENVAPISAEGDDWSQVSYDDREDGELGAELPALGWFGHAVLQPHHGDELAGTVLISGDRVAWAGRRSLLGSHVSTVVLRGETGLGPGLWMSSERFRGARRCPIP
jgi:hypothetical protein